MRLIQTASLVSAVILLVTILAPVRLAEARADYQGSIEIQARICPAGAVDLSAECTSERGPLGVLFAIDDGRSSAMDSAGTILFENQTAGTHVVVMKASPYAERFREVHAFCSNSAAGIYPGPVLIDTSNEPQFQVLLAPRSRAACQLYFVP